LHIAHSWQTHRCFEKLIAGGRATTDLSARTLFTKQATAPGATGLGSTVTLQWTAVPDEGYWVCWDTIDNGACGTTWVPNGYTTKGLSDLSPGAYYWPFDLVDPRALRATLSERE